MLISNKYRKILKIWQIKYYLLRECRIFYEIIEVQTNSQDGAHTITVLILIKGQIIKITFMSKMTN